MKKIVIDLETTGFGNSDRITEIAIIKFDDKEIISEYQSLVNPEKPIPDDIVKKTGITNEMVSTAPTFKEILDDLIPHLEFSRVIIAHNASFDKRMLSNQLRDNGISLSIPWECTMQLSKKMWPGRASHSLPNLCAALNIEHKNAHRAMADADATRQLYLKIKGIY